jgi:small ligand-binding sensory domain FIST
METFKFACSSGDTSDVVGAELVEQLGDIPSEATLGFVYGTDATANILPETINGLREATGIKHWTGTIGLGMNVMGEEFYDTPTIAVMLGAFDSDDFRVIEPQAIDVSGFVATNEKWLDAQDHYFGVVHGDPSNPRSPEIIDALAESVPNAFFVGGLTSSNSQNLQVSDSVTSGGVSGALFSSRVPLVTGHTQGCSPIADSHEVTRCERNIAIELDGRPALDVLREDVGEIIAKDLQRMAGYIFAALPISASDTGDYLVRNIVGVDEEQKLVGIGDVLTEGMELMICRRDGSSARQDMQRMLDDISQRATGNARGALYYSCLARGRNQFGENSEEMKMIQESLGDIPLVGFFANGEIFHNRLYAYTGVLSVFC